MRKPSRICGTKRNNSNLLKDCSSAEAAGKLLIKCPDDDGPAHPHCPHGPTLFFYRDGAEESGYYACAAHRDRKDGCGFHLPAAQLTAKHLLRRYAVDDVVAQHEQQRRKLQQAGHKQLHYCLKCDLLLLHAELQPHAGHPLQRNLSAAALQDPTQFLPPHDNDKVQAQYFFDADALQFFAQCLSDLHVRRVVCIGAPRLHAHLRTHCADQLQSFLLDLDGRFGCFYEDTEFAWYNMCSNHFFLDRQRNAFAHFLDASVDGVLLFTDPPFGCRTEPIAHTLRQLTRQYNRLHRLPHAPLPIFWIFPYFAASHVQQQMPALDMCDYKINYTNHAAYTNVGPRCRKLGSPVRLFTNVPLRRLTLPSTDGDSYRYCVKCARYTALENRHCDKCGCCPSGNGAAYRHCERCAECVKPNYVHCGECRRCTQLADHDCVAYQAHQRCWLCRQRGHIEWQCRAWWRRRKHEKQRSRLASARATATIVCLLCGSTTHNERRCAQRHRHIEEVTFMGETQVVRFL